LRQVAILLAALLLFSAGCGGPGATDIPGGPAQLRKAFRRKPQMRMGSYPTSTLGTVFPDPGSLGQHGYKKHPWEVNGILYTCRGGHIDLAHLRKAADWTAYLAAQAYKNLMEGDRKYRFKLYERSRYHVNIQYPQDWKDLPKEQKQQIAYEMAVRLGQYCAHTALIWHEILTWFGYKCTGTYSEFPSAFSWEDSFSDLLGTLVAAKALKDKEHPYDEALTIALENELQKLGVQPSYVARRASEMVRGKWFSGDLVFFITMKKRNFDVGLDDGFITPRLVPGVAQCPDAKPLPYPVPTSDFSDYGFTIKIEIEPREWETGKIMRVLRLRGEHPQKRIDPEVDLARIMEYIRRDAVYRYGEDADS